MKYSSVLIVIAVSVDFVQPSLYSILAQEYSPSGRDYVPHIENYNVSFNPDEWESYGL